MFGLLRGYQTQWLRGDIVAGITVAAIAIPESLGYATVAGLPPQTGLYCALLPPILFALLASSRQLVVGADSATAALVATGAAAIAATGTPEYSNAVAQLAVITALVLLAMAALRLGFLANLISQPVLIGFLAGVGVSLIIGKLPDVLGIPASGTTWDKLLDTIRELGDINPASALLGFGVVAVMVGALKLPARVPAALFALVVFSIVGVLIGAEGRGVAMVGALPAGLPSLTVPTFDIADLGVLTSTAGAIAIVILAQSAAVARSFAIKNRYPVDINSDLVGLAAANAGSAITGGFAINGSPPRTAAGDAAGSRSQVINIGMAVVIGAVLLFASGLFAYVPSPVLDGIVLGIGIHLVNVPELRRIATVSRFEFGTALLALVVVAFVGVEQGVLLAVIVSIIVRAAQEYRARDEVLLADGVVSARAAERLAEVPRALQDGVFAYRFDAALFFGNAARFEERLHEAMARVTPPPHTLVVDGGGMTEIDFTGLGALRRISDQLKAGGGRIVLTDLADAARAAIDRSDLREHVIVVPHLEDAFTQSPASSGAASDQSTVTPPPASPSASAGP